jgi:carboxynorspermidine decarboxylase
MVGTSGMRDKVLYPSPCFILEEKKLQKNLLIFQRLQKQTNVIWLYTLKCFNEKEGLALISDTFSGFSIGNSTELSQASSSKNSHIHSYAPAFYPEEVEMLATQSDTMSFNSLSQWNHYHQSTAKHSSIGLRINPKLALNQPSYCDASSTTSRFGVDYKVFLEAYQGDKELFFTLEGLHFHAFCHQNITALQLLLEHISYHYQAILPRLKWLNLGGGQNFTETEYDVEGFIVAINAFQHQYPSVKIYFEPGSTVVNDTGDFMTTVLDIIPSTPPQVILDTSIETHLLDVAITQRSLKRRGQSETSTDYMYVLTGVSCITGDILGLYYFDKALEVGDKVYFANMIGYSLVKQTTFNGIKKARFFINRG